MHMHVSGGILCCNLSSSAKINVSRKMIGLDNAEVTWHNEQIVNPMLPRTVFQGPGRQNHAPMQSFFIAYAEDKNTT